MAKLTKVQEASLRAILDAGGTVLPEGGGWWRDLAGNRLTIHNPSKGNCQQDIIPIATPTIYALERRGILLPRPEDKSLPPHRQGRVVAANYCIN